jgi:hypothetical protein
VISTLGTLPQPQQLRVGRSIQLLLSETAATCQDRIAYRHYTQLNGSWAIGVVSFVGTVCVGHLVGSFQSLHFVFAPTLARKAAAEAWYPDANHGVHMSQGQIASWPLGTANHRHFSHLSISNQTILDFELWRVACTQESCVGSIGRLWYGRSRNQGNSGSVRLQPQEDEWDCLFPNEPTAFQFLL